MNCATLEQAINRHLQTTKNATYCNQAGQSMFTSATVCVQRGNHPKFAALRNHIPHHLTPEELFQNDYPDAEGSSLNVVCIALHFAESIVRDNAKASFYPSDSWYELSYHVDYMLQAPLVPQSPFSEFLRDIFSGYRVVFPINSSIYRVEQVTPMLRRANWSERHVAYIGGLGSFGLHGSLITEKGCACRLINIVTDCPFPAEEYRAVNEDYNYNCLYFQKGVCRQCQKRCPVDSIVGDDHLVERCYGHEYIASCDHAKDRFGAAITACALCLCGVPCSFTNPMSPLQKTAAI